MKRKPLTVGDLRRMEDRIEHMEPRPFLYCPVCGGQYSASAGDYFMADDATLIRHCRKAMRLVQRETRLVEVA